MNDRTDETMTLARFAELLNAYGAELSRWPEVERDAAQRLCAGDAEAMRLRATAEKLDALLNAVPAHEPSAVLRARVAEITIRHPRPGSQASRLPFAHKWWQVAFAGAFASVLGVISGAWTAEDPTTAATASVTSTGGAGSAGSVDTDPNFDTAADDGWDELTTVAFASNLDEEL